MTKAKKDGDKPKTRSARFAHAVGNFITFKKPAFKIIVVIVGIIIVGLSFWLLYGNYQRHKEMTQFRKTVESKKILSRSREECKKSSQGLDAYNKCLQSRIDKAVDEYASQLYAKLKKLCGNIRSSNKFPYCVQNGLHRAAWDSNDLILKLIAIRVIEKLKSPPKEVKDDAAKYYGDAMKIWNKGRLVFITPAFPRKSESSKKPSK